MGIIAPTFPTQSYCLLLLCCPHCAACQTRGKPRSDPGACSPQNGDTENAVPGRQTLLMAKWPSQLQHHERTCVRWMADGSSSLVAAKTGLPDARASSPFALSVASTTSSQHGHISTLLPTSRPMSRAGLYCLQRASARPPS